VTTARLARLREHIAAQQSPWTRPVSGGFSFRPVIQEKRIILFSAAHWPHIPLAAIAAIVAALPLAIAAYEFLKLVRGLFRKPPSERDA
jgi:hypothetical protein